MSFQSLIGNPAPQARQFVPFSRFFYLYLCGGKSHVACGIVGQP
jgi:hypothetical protein